MTQKNLEQVPTSNLYFGNLPVGNKYPLFGICRNNVSESIANSHNMSNVRYTIPPISISLWIQNSIKILLNYKKRLKRHMIKKFRIQQLVQDVLKLIKEG